MRNLLFMALLIIIQLSFLHAQPTPQIREELRPMSKGSHNALIVDLPRASYKKVQKIWKKYTRKYRGRLKYDRKTKEFFLDNTRVKKISDNSIDVTMQIYEKGENACEIVVWINLGVTYLSSQEYPIRYKAAHEFLSNFSLLVSTDWLKDKIEEEEKLMTEMDKEYKDLQNEKLAEQNNILKQEETIVKAEESIKNSEKKIEENVKEQEQQEVIISDQKKVIEELKKKLKKLERY